MKPIKPLYVLILIIIFAAAGFYGGIVYHKGQNAGGGQGFGGRFGGGGRANFQAGPRPVAGQIISQNNNSVTIKLADGSSKIINLTDQTAVNKTTTGSVSDLKSGERITALGTTNSDGSITAQTVLIGNGVLFRGVRESATPSAQ